MSYATLNLIALVCSAVGMFGIGMKTSDKFWRSIFFIFAALNTLLVVSHFLFRDRLMNR
jgi:predicted membrane protein